MPPTTLLLDRDGTLIRETPRSARRVQDVRPIASTLAALAALHGAARLLCLTNQSIIGRGQVSAATVDAVNARLTTLCAARGVQIEAFLVCPHAPWDGCPCRKPLPGLVDRAVAEHGIQRASAWVVGNRLSDAQMAAAAGCAGAVLLRNPPLDAELRDASLPPGAILVTRRALARTLRGIIGA